MTPTATEMTTRDQRERVCVETAAEDDVDTRELEVFIAVVEHGHFGRAGRQVFLSQSGVTRAIKRLESELGARLLDRSGQGVTLTTAGHAFLPWARRILGMVQRSRDDVAQSQQGRTPTLIIGASHTSSLMTRRFKILGATAEVRHCASAHQLTALRQGQMDVVVSVSAIDAEDVACVPLGHEHYHALLPRTHAMAGEDTVSFPAWLAQPHILLSQQLEPTLHALITQLARANGVQCLEIVQEFDDMLQIFEAVAAGMGFGAVPQSWTQIHHDGVVSRALGKNARLMTYAMYLSAHHDARLERFVAQAKQMLAAQMD